MNTTLLDSPTPADVAAREQKFDWPVCYEAEDLVLGLLDGFLQRHAFARRLSTRMREETGTLMLDWVDHLILPTDREPALRAAGFTEDPLGECPDPAARVLWHPEAMLPRVILRDGAAAPTLALRAESVTDFLAAHDLGGRPIEGGPFAPYRRCRVSEEDGGAGLEVVERRGYRGYVPREPDADAALSFLQARELWHTRPRRLDDDAAGFRDSLETLAELIRRVGRDLACHIVFAEEREFWEKRNHAARLQRRRQDVLGLGWANQDHHTYRSSREHFVDLMQALEMLGFERRERYYAGSHAGWGAQILEQPVEGIVVFADVDLLPEETEIDFSRRRLPRAPKLSTVGLWVGLHGESFLDAGMHHLEARFDFGLLTEQLAGEGVNTMKPFSDFPFLKQAFTQGERWPVRPARAQRLLREGFITEEQCAEFIAKGAIGSHLENLQRRGGFKGFNQKSVSVIIEATDPRRQQAGVH